RAVTWADICDLARTTGNRFLGDWCGRAESSRQNPGPIAVHALRVAVVSARMLEQEHNHPRERNTGGHLHHYAYCHLRYGDAQLSVYSDRELRKGKCADKERRCRSKKKARFAD